MSHSHSQIIGLPVVPSTVSSRLRSMMESYGGTGKCGLCEAWSEDIIIHQSQYFSSIAPVAASYPFEIWVVPRDHLSHFHEIDREKVLGVGCFHLFSVISDADSIGISALLILFLLLYVIGTDMVCHQSNYVVKNWSDNSLNLWFLVVNNWMTLMCSHRIN